ncbi:MAG: hypothetical protein PeribacterA2_0157 [Candidatus Peribacter riflensis]|uniref:Uncharacterized protein n=1 Tax=Candidatus Peribacter riflensis TaxID=1735162 RepID=A0A0S1SI47_9BACT|nr:MAG: hypothetical protein PeribacterA2_0157 [Candidatus Peribacter riflensis]ALM10654.1 MAG: hypothetical protein PeribacterB2_0157 [Candidatus Peribacter riflensis]ALM11756.1 MAG: hypothetical protein PeribacterC2_0156 [Candidatus Peribacter riflensis]ALM12859.1 MAG: hypothetical protein PeribacterD1_0157 [Candidatus Peribacter riflensis]ALM13960.1 MAG: hypothetical protein PeribacterD2_0157 [Candidatus Peribacter riflensis]
MNIFLIYMFMKRITFGLLADALDRMRTPSPTDNHIQYCVHYLCLI